MRTVATFDSREFNLTEHREYFINEGCFGDDLGRWLIGKLRAAGADTASEPGQEDFGWYVDYTVGIQPFCAVIGNVSGEFWFIVVERAAGFLGSVLGRRRRNIPESGITCLHQILSSCSEVSRLKWHHWDSFKRGAQTRLRRAVTRRVRPNHRLQPTALSDIMKRPISVLDIWFAFQCAQAIGRR